MIVRGYNQANMTEETVTGSDGKRETIKVSTPKSETISVMAMIEAAHKAEEKPGEWVDVDD